MADCLRGMEETAIALLHPVFWTNAGFIAS